ncbi:MAG: hypothetical protein HY267_06620, partial [Deltaproteobacteria bacterium]|nr:hypothetical protein [Deltaproteobacteria bacterium]
VAVGGSITGAGQFKPGTTILTGTGQELRAGQYQNVTVQGQVTVVESVVISGNLQLNNGSVLDLNGQVVEVQGNLTIAGGQLKLTDMADLVRVRGNVSFPGSSVDTRATLTAGVLEVGGNFTVGCSSGFEFAASGSQRVVFNGTSPQTVNMACVDATNNHFQDVEIANAAGVTFTSFTQINGQLIVASGLTPTVSGNGVGLTTAGVNVDGLVLDNVLLTISGGVVTRFDDVTFQNYNPTATQLTINLGVVDATFYGLTFLVEPTTGFYIKANDTDGAGTLARIAMINASPVDGSNHTKVTGGFIVTWGIQ